jgi:hypothetical protein
MGLLLFSLLILAVLLNHGAFGARWRGIVRRALGPALMLGGIGFAAGFFGPMAGAGGQSRAPARHLHHRAGRLCPGAGLRDRQRVAQFGLLLHGGLTRACG